VLLERDDDLRALSDALERVRATGRGEIAVVGADAGGGKTSLVRAFCDRSDAVVWWGSCDNFRAPRPLGPLADVAMAAGGPLARAFAADASRREVFQVTLETLRSASKPVVLVIEDVHWADDATLDVVTYLGRRIGHVSALLVLTVRNDELGTSHPVRSVLAEVTENVHTRRQLAPLSIDAIAHLGNDQALDVVALHERTAGNPFFVTECLATGGVLLPPSVVTRCSVERHGSRGRRAERSTRRRSSRATSSSGCSTTSSDLRAPTSTAASTQGCSSSSTGVWRSATSSRAWRSSMPFRRYGVGASTDGRWPRSSTRRSRTWHASRTTPRRRGTGRPRCATLLSRPGPRWRSARTAPRRLTSALQHGDQLSFEELVHLQEALAQELHLLNQLDDSVDTYRAAIAACRASGDVRKEGELLVRIAGPLVIAGRQAEADTTVRPARPSSSRSIRVPSSSRRARR
jgi:hypothetical protein